MKNFAAALCAVFVVSANAATARPKAQARAHTLAQQDEYEDMVGDYYYDSYYGYEE